MAIEKVKEYFAKFGIQDRIMEMEQSSATVELAAQAVGCEPGRIAKTLSFMQGDDAALIVTSGDARIDNKKYREYFRVKAKMIPFDEVEERIGHAPGGVCPFAVNDGVAVYLDDSLKKYDVVYPAAGSDNSAIGLTPRELERYSKARGWVDVCKLQGDSWSDDA